MAIPPTLIDDIRERADIVSIISEYVPLKKRGPNFIGQCPFHQEKTPSFTVNPQKNIWHCFGCGEGGNVYTFLMKINNSSFIEVVEDIAERVGVTLPESSYDKEQKEKYAYLYSQLEKEYQAYMRNLSQSVGEQTRTYLEKRGITKEIVDQFHLGFSTAGRFRERLIFPIFDIRGRCLAFGGRIMSDSNKIAKYINSAESPIYTKGNHLYGLNVAKAAIQKQDRVIVVEGYMDAIACHQFGLGNTVAVLGTALTINQARLLARFTKNIVLAFDSDDAGKKATLRSLELLSSLDLNLSSVILPGKDPDETLRKIGIEKFQKLIDSAVPRLKYQIDSILNEYEIGAPEGKAHAARACRQLLEKEDAVLQSEYKKYLAKCLKVDYVTLQNYFLDNADTGRNVPRVNASPVDKGKKIALGLLNLSLKNTDVRREVFTQFVSDDFIDERLITLASHLENSNEEFQKFIDDIPDPSLRNKAVEIAFEQMPVDFTSYLNAFKNYKQEKLLKSIKDRMRVAEQSHDIQKISELQQEYQSLKKMMKKSSKAEMN
ncbi:MAG: CHC2 zinc finger domain-containing protein [Candidatus Margulisiibacteriota bacterium]